MTDREVQEGFDEVYNRFWRKYRNSIQDKHSDEWERMHTYSVVLQKKYPFLSQAVQQMEIELDERMRKQ